MTKINIFVSHRTDQENVVIENEIFKPVLCGADLIEPIEGVTLPDILKDNSGDNISSSKKAFSELTVQYWAWKNVTDADYYGLCHYRRYFSFADKEFKIDKFTNLPEESLNDSTIDKYQLENLEQIESIVTGYDIVVTTPCDVTNIGYKTVREHYGKSPNLDSKDLEILENVVKRSQPEYLKTLREVLESKTFSPCCMFIMKKQYFKEYCEWLYPLLFQIEKELPVTPEKDSVERQRALGHLGERLLEVFVQFKRKKGAKVKVLQRVFFLKTEQTKVVKPLSPEATPVVVSFNDFFVPYAYCSLKSALQCVKQGNGLDVVVLHTDITKENQKLLEGLFEDFRGSTVRFYDVTNLVGEHEFITNGHIPVQSFYRLFIPAVMCQYNKVIWLDVDTIVKQDLKELLQSSDNDSVINATIDADFAFQYNSVEKVRKYTNKILNIPKVSQYFQAGVFVFNIEKFKKKYNLTDLLNFAAKREYKYMDQDVMNSYFKGDINFIDMSWNVMQSINKSRSNNIKLFAPERVSDAYIEARKFPKIIHYAGDVKPWFVPDGSSDRSTL